MRPRIPVRLINRWQGWFAKRVPVSAGTTTLQSRRVYILPTRLGWGFAAALLVLVLLGINYRNNLIYGLAFWLAGIALVALVQTQRQLPGLRLRLLPIKPVFVGENITLCLQASTPDKRGARGLAVSVAWPERNEVLARVHIDAGQLATLNVVFPAEQRGEFVAPLLRVTSNYPLGLFESWSFVRQSQKTLIYPRPATEAELPAAAPLLQGESATAAQAGSDEYDGLRRYREGDPMRHIAWKATAQKASARPEGKPTADDLLTKSFYAEAAEQLRFEFTAAMAITGNIEAALSLLCRWVLDARAQQIAYELIVGGESFDGLDPELAALALFGADAAGNGSSA